jgi:hypothetical protein
MTCTTLDHCYPPSPDGSKPADGTPCFCGKRRWNQDGMSYTGPTAAPVRARTFPPRKGSRVELRSFLGGVFTVTEVDRDAAMFRASVPGHETRWFEEGDLA